MSSFKNLFYGAITGLPLSLSLWHIHPPSLSHSLPLSPSLVLLPFRSTVSLVTHLCSKETDALPVWKKIQIESARKKIPTDLKSEWFLKVEPTLSDPISRRSSDFRTMWQKTFGERLKRIGTQKPKTKSKTTVWNVWRAPEIFFSFFFLAWLKSVCWCMNASLMPAPVQLEQLNLKTLPC